MRDLRVVLLLGSCIGLISSQTEDFAFEQENMPTQSLPPLRRLWGIPDSRGQVGRFLQISVPADAFEGVISKYEASGAGGKALPSWLRLDSTTGLLEGVPGEGDEGEVYIAMVAVGPQRQHTAKDYFAIEVLPHSYTQHSLIKERCSPGEDVTTLTVVVDKDYKSMTTDNKISVLTNLGRYLGMSHEKLSLIPQSTADVLTDSAIMAGPGNTKRKLADHSSVIQWQVGCGGKVLPKYSSQVQQVKHDAYDGTLAEVLQFPVIGWHLTVSSSNPPFRHRRQVVGSGDSENDLEDLDTLEEEIVAVPAETGVEEAVPESRVVPIAASPVFAEPSTTVPTVVHPHRHHHGELPASIEPTYTSLLTSPAPFATIMPTPTYDPERPAVFPTLLVTASQVEEFSVAPTPVVSQVEPSVTPEMPTPQETDPQVVESSSEQSSTEALTTAPPPLEATTKQTVEVVTAENTPPTINFKLPRQAITAGKPFRYVIPEDVFSDLEDGNTRKLHLTLKTQEGSPVHYSWIHFNPENQEVIALPLEEHVSRWAFTLEARDAEGLAVNDTLELNVQNHKARRTVTHALTLDLALQSTPAPVEWQLAAVERLAALYGDHDTALITVLGVTPQDDPITFTWTNDSLPRNHCPREQIDNLLRVLRANEDGKPTDAVRNLLSPQITVVRVSWVGRGTCETAPAPKPLPPSTQNFSPIPRNQVDLLNATLGQLLVYTVPEDTFYDPEDGSTRNMKLSLLNMDRSPIGSTHWLQFDIKNQEFYGIPMAVFDIGRREYQLVCKDSGGLTAYDGLVVVVHPPAKTLYNVEFSMTLDIEHDTFAYNPAMKRHFVERLAELFGDRNASAIVLSGVSANPTHIVWHNRSLPTDKCPDEEIKHLRQILLGDNDRVSVQVNTVLGPEFPVTQASLIPTASCQAIMTVTHPVEPVYPSGDVRPVSRSNDEYLVTVIVPAIVIAAMLLCASLVACALYRRRRTGKMSVGSEDERQSFRSKGIPVIFQDELEERPEPANKSPVIMKEEKPPLPPPEYHQRTALLSDTDHHEDSPYQPPPPFPTSRDSARPKPTPTYRMPPPN
ncbi:cytoskeletal anchoring at plasma membrane [Homalodisca vitripennis]|nr:cytoskeletal anchoring at plasma membrane [Homalodisca vitripennis]